jgi:hypothetical protein
LADSSSVFTGTRVGVPRHAPGEGGEVSTDRLGHALPETAADDRGSGGPDAPRVLAESHVEAFEFVRFCYRRRAVAWPALYDEMCAVAASGDYRGMGYEQLEQAGIGLALTALPLMAEMSERVIAEERSQRLAKTA